MAQSFVQRCFEQEASKHLEEQGYHLEETHELEMPDYLEIDEFARRKGHRYDTSNSSEASIAPLPAQKRGDKEALWLNHLVRETFQATEFPL